MSLIRPYLPGDEDADDLLLRMDLEASLDRFVLDRQRLVGRLETLSASEWAQTASHGEYRTYSVFIMFALRNCCFVLTGRRRPMRQVACQRKNASC